MATAWKVRGGADGRSGVWTIDRQLAARTFQEIRRSLFGPEKEPKKPSGWASSVGRPSAEEAMRLSYSLAVRRALASLFDVDEDEEAKPGCVTLHHMHRVFRQTFLAGLSIWGEPEGAAIDAFTDRLDEVLEQNGLVWWRDLRVMTAPPAWTRLCAQESGAEVVLLRGFGPGLAVRMSGACPWLASAEGLPEEACRTPEDYLQFSELHPEELLRCFLAGTGGRTPHPAAGEWEYLQPTPTGGCWRREPPEIAVTVARSIETPGGRSHALVVHPQGSGAKSVLIRPEAARLIPELMLGVLLRAGSRPLARVERMAGGVVCVCWQWLPPPPLRRLFNAAVWPEAHDPEFNAYTQTMSEAVFDAAAPLLLQTGFQLETLQK